MEKKKRLIKETVWLICSLVGGIILILTLYRLLDVDVNLENIVLGEIVILVATYVVRLTLWVFKESL
jgi:hypothetical protein